jgi:hypothetical protein
VHLPRFVRLDEPRPSFWSIYLPLWGGARAAPQPADAEDQQEPVETAR